MELFFLIPASVTRILTRLELDSFFLLFILVKAIFNKQLFFFLGRPFKSFVCYRLPFEYSLLAYVKLNQLMTSLIKNGKVEPVWSRGGVLEVIRKDTQPLNPPIHIAPCVGEGKCCSAVELVLLWQLVP